MRRLLRSRLRVVVAVAVVALAGTGSAAAAGLPLLSGMLWAGTQHLTKGTCPGPSGSDTTVDQGNATSTGGGQSTLTVLSKTNGSKRAFIQFDLSSCGLPATAGADSATLTLTVTASSKGPDTIAAYPVYSSWSAGTLTWSAAQSLTVGSSPTGTFSSSTGTKTLTVTADLDAAIKGGAFYGWELVDTTGTNNASATIGASAGPAGQRPTLTVNYER